MEIITDFALIVFSAAFITGFVITVISGSAKAIKILLAILSLLFLLAIIAGFIFSRGFLIFLVTQLIALILIFYFVIVAGAVVGGGVYALMHKTHAYRNLTDAELHDFIAITEFCETEGITEERALSRIRNGYYQGGLCNKAWYIHSSELS